MSGKHRRRRTEPMPLSSPVAVSRSSEEVKKSASVDPEFAKMLPACPAYDAAIRQFYEIVELSNALKQAMTDFERCHTESAGATSHLFETLSLCVSDSSFRLYTRKLQNVQHGGSSYLESMLDSLRATCFKPLENYSSTLDEFTNRIMERKRIVRKYEHCIRRLQYCLSHPDETDGKQVDEYTEKVEKVKKKYEKFHSVLFHDLEEFTKSRNDFFAVPFQKLVAAQASYVAMLNDGLLSLGQSPFSAVEPKQIDSPRPSAPLPGRSFGRRSTSFVDKRTRSDVGPSSSLDKDRLTSPLPIGFARTSAPVSIRQEALDGRPHAHSSPDSETQAERPPSFTPTHELSLSVLPPRRGAESPVSRKSARVRTSSISGASGTSGTSAGSQDSFSGGGGSSSPEVRQPGHSRTKSNSSASEGGIRTIPEDQKDITLLDVLQNPQAARFFKKFCFQEYCQENVLFWLDIEYFRKVSLQDKSMMMQLFPKICNKYIVIGSVEQINVSDSLRSDIVEKFKTLNGADSNIGLSLVPIDESVFDEAQKEVYGMMCSDLFKRFLKSAHWAEWMKVSGPNVGHRARRYSYDWFNETADP